ncbi:D-glycero-alpha-D-manno-heptose-1,7-bisphosphate 7-phosphatase [Helicobacter cappadocius]|uniref:D,D-heptose 1,7-bisphosphate phosphatase n=1 Tax=Helicobacter cappadocius TaxID=3063998 RepID=A0AA90PRL8_9HELI|nr:MULTISPECIES: HAD family hydrolase [unclassified Helicobacter]MDO7253837.1 HAD family hydrolase [Helicobacter sp. faydin-H75]MDP2539726.1 HAD family hydrolase [Helicobacter sp. faydin-H76]
MKAVFFDRDGVINQDFGYVYEAKEFIFVDNIFNLLKYCKDKGFLLLLITNQSGIGRGYYTLKDFEELTDYMQNELKKKLGFGFDRIYFCPHSPEENCLCRKPKTGMIDEAKKDYNLDLKECFIIGDKSTDIEAGQNANIGHKIFLKNTNEGILNDKGVHTVFSVNGALEVMISLLGK